MSVEQILFQAGMVGAFIVFTIVMRRMEDSERTNRDDQWREFIKGRDSLMVDLMDREREHRKEIMTDAVGSIEQLTDAIAKMDQRSTEQHAGLLLAIHQESATD